MRRLITTFDIEKARSELARLLEARREWFIRERAARMTTEPTTELRHGEWELSLSAGALVFSYWSADGARIWRIEDWCQSGAGIHLEVSRRMRAERATLELIPRAAVAEGTAQVRAARLAVCERLAHIFAEQTGLCVESARLSAGARRADPGRYARIILRGRLESGARAVARRKSDDGRGARMQIVAATAPVVPAGGVGPESFLASALLWLARLEERGRLVRELWLAADARLAATLNERLALLESGLRRKIVLLEVNEELSAAARVEQPPLSELLARRVPRLYRPRPPQISELTESLIALAPEAIDVVRARHGETLRFHGLPFARARRVAGHEMLWFGAGPSSERRLLDDDNKDELLRLVSELIEHRRADSINRRHLFHRAAPEAWLESILRRDITRLDPGLRLAPLHAQLRASRAFKADGARPLDLLALRRDGRLVVIELKVSEDVALALQGADYWLRIHTHHRADQIRHARLFDDAEIADDPPLVYLVAPLMRFHRSFHRIARCISSEIEMYRFDINEDWRAGVRVTRRAPLIITAI